MRIIGIDPGYAIVGYGVLDLDKSRFSVVNYGAITTNAGTSFDRRLMEIYSDMCTVLDMFKPDCMSIEKLYFTNNKTTGIDVAQARGGQAGGRRIRQGGEAPGSGDGEEYSAPQRDPQAGRYGGRSGACDMPRAFQRLPAVAADRKGERKQRRNGKDTTQNLRRVTK